LKNAPPVVLYYSGLSQPRIQEAELMESELQAIGLKVTMHPETGGDYYGGLPFTAWNIAVAGWCSDFPDAAQYFDAVVGTGNISRFSNPSFTQAADHAASLSGSARARAYAALDKLLMTTYAPIAPLSVDNARYLTSKRVRNYVFSQSLDAPLLNAMSVR
jgi:ABC-type transport system substrate-binding protein